jgi:DNA-directed RNA polymerase subunit RPC12/RpoP
MIGFALKISMNFSVTFLNNPRWMAVFLFAATSSLVYLYLRWLPYQYAVMNHIRVAYHCVICWTTLALLVLVFPPGIRYSDSPEAVEFRCRACGRAVAGGPNLLRMCFN